MSDGCLFTHSLNSHYCVLMSARPAFVSLSAVVAVAVRPTLWTTAIRQVSRLAPRGWWRTAPFLPVPPADYMDFRLVTQYGGEHGGPQGGIRSKDVVDYLQWCKQWNQAQ